MMIPHMKHSLSLTLQHLFPLAALCAISGCSSVQGDITDLHTEMDLHNGTGVLGDDDPIYLSRGEIPLSMPDI
ncbi:hypothetical protein GIB67_004513 [Kingdonia uniflora]|uniref:Uncharacterized protein n=1 Tax=Kingdonia uniflora TaxID=39325 RepID=A0A7J7LSI5_9MAGN|nr:hypothetical protein GIB67_004513 [Kingdonia uniflora]